MATLTKAEVRAITVVWLLPKAGLNPLDKQAREMFVEIAREESGFNTDAVGPNGEVGLWQIHPVHFPTAESEWDISDPEINLTNPFNNAVAAGHVFKAQGYSAWTTANAARISVGNSRNIEEELTFDDARAIIREINIADFGMGPDVDPATGLVLDAVDELTPEWMQSLGRLLANLLDPTFWRRIGIGVLGGLVILTGLFLWNKDDITQTAKAIK